MKKLLYPSLALVAIMSLTSCNNNDNDKKDYQKPEPQQTKTDSATAYIERGEYLVNTIGCADCHSPKQMGQRGPELVGGKMFSGFQEGNTFTPVSSEIIQSGNMIMNADLTAFQGPWGVSYSANITPSDTGIGNWTLEQFATSLTEGKLKGQKNGRDLLPPMPWQNLSHLTDEDVKAIYSYLMSVPPVDNAVPAPTPPTGAPENKKA